MNKETELYLIKRIEELAKEQVLAEKENCELRQQLQKPMSEKTYQKANAYDVLSRFIIIQPNPVNETYKLVFNIPEVEINRELAEMFIDLLGW